ncbi:MAG: DUF72 domain-containing protein [Candidatus Sumerlaeota bacterium]
MPNGKLFIGCSGYQYGHWKGCFYPDDLPKGKWLDYYQDHFDTVEINNSFYQLPDKKTFDSWREQAAEKFTFTLKFSRYGTHMKKLKDPEEPIEKFLDHATHLGSHIGAILVQLPPNWNSNPERLDGFLSAAPDRHRWAVEFRDESWLNEENFEILERYNAALCIHDIIPDHPRRQTADWSYWRFHGDPPGESYSHQHLSARADEIAAEMQDGRDVYAYFNNDKKGYALQNASQLRRYLKNR